MSEIKMLSLPNWLLEGFTDPTIEKLTDYARACAAHATAAKDAEIKALRAERAVIAAKDAEIAGWKLAEKSEYDLRMEAEAEIERLRAEREVIVAEAVKYAGKSGRLEAKVDRLAEALRLIASPKRPDGTWNRDREACRQIAENALRDHDQEGKDG